MRIADLTAGAAKLRDAADVLAVRWDETRRDWSDANSRSLEENHLRAMATEISSALSAVQHLAEVLAQAQRECEQW